MSSAYESHFQVSRAFACDEPSTVTGLIQVWMRRIRAGVADNYETLAEVIDEYFVTFVDTDFDTEMGEARVLLVAVIHEVLNDSDSMFCVGPNPTQDLELLAVVARFLHRDSLIAHSLAMNPYCPADALEEISRIDLEDTVISLAELVAVNPSTSPETLMHLSGHHVAAVRHAVATNIATPRACLSKLALDPEFSETLARAGAHYPTYFIRAAVAMNISTPLYALRGMANRSQPYVFDDELYGSLDLDALEMLGFVEGSFSHVNHQVAQWARDTLVRLQDDSVVPADLDTPAPTNGAGQVTDGDADDASVTDAHTEEFREQLEFCEAAAAYFTQLIANGYQMRPEFLDQFEMLKGQLARQRVAVDGGADPQTSDAADAGDGGPDSVGC